jgi:glyoxylase-like metal-dependent hydrolase (beta-lactamase superfamily II)
MQLEIHRYVSGIFFENTYLVINNNSKSAIIIDPGFGSASQVENLMKEDIKIEVIFITHPHFDHAYDLGRVKELTNAKIYMHQDDLPVAEDFVQEAASYGYAVSPMPVPDVFCEDGDTFYLGDTEFTILHIPGHTPGSICLKFNEGVFTGDTLMSRKIGDSYDGYFSHLISGIKQKLYALPDHFTIYPGHYKYSTIGEEKKFNLDVF